MTGPDENAAPGAIPSATDTTTGTGTAAGEDSPAPKQAKPVDYKVLKRPGERPTPPPPAPRRPARKVSTSAGSGLPVRAIALGVIVIWTIFFVVANLAQFSAGDGASWTSLIADWAIPVVLVIGIWLLVSGPRATPHDGFGDEADAMAAQAAGLEERLIAINRELAQSREVMAGHAGDLESFSESAITRIAANADRLEALVIDKGEQLDAIAQRSAEAVASTERLQETLPALAGAAREVSEEVERTGETAQARIDEIVQGFARLDQARATSGEGITALRNLINEQLGGMTGQAGAIEKAAVGRLDELRRQADVFDQELKTREDDSFTAIRRRAAVLHKELSEQDIALLTRAGDALDEVRAKMAEVREEGIRLAGTIEKDQGTALSLLDRSVDGVEERLREALDRVAEVERAANDNARARLAQLHDEAGQVALPAPANNTGNVVPGPRDGQHDQTRLAQLSDLADKGEALADRMAEIDERLAALSGRTDGVPARANEAADALSAKLAASRDLIAESGASIEKLTGSSTRLLELLQASKTHTGDDLVQAVTTAESVLVSFEERTVKLRSALDEAQQKGAALAASVERAQTGSAQSVETIDQLDKRLADVADRSASLAQSTRRELDEAVTALEGATDTMLARFREGQDNALRELTETIGTRGQDAIMAALGSGGGDDVIAQLETAAKEAVRTGRETLAQLREQIEQVDELAGNMEARVAQARRQAQSEIDSDFSREMAQIVDGLQARSVDITRAFSTEVPDEDWQAYLQGDRGRFARRAVKLLDTKQADAVHSAYRDKADLHETVDTYIRDFEAMLRVILGTRQGHAIAVTLLSSDIGKLYVALAQAIARLED